MAGFCERGVEPSHFIEFREFLDYCGLVSFSRRILVHRYGLVVVVVVVVVAVVAALLL
jgi:hypothetical protein